MKTITFEMLEKAQACPEQVKIFHKHFPSGSVVPTLELARRYAKIFDWDFAATHFLPAAAEAAYQKATATAYTAYHAATATAEAAYQKATAYRAATATAEAAYLAATAPAYTAYRAATATAFFREWEKM